jgi:hypothetical protein
MSLFSLAWFGLLSFNSSVCCQGVSEGVVCLCQFGYLFWRRWIFQLGGIFHLLSLFTACWNKEICLGRLFLMNDTGTWRLPTPHFFFFSYKTSCETSCAPCPSPSAPFRPSSPLASKQARHEKGKCQIPLHPLPPVLVFLIHLKVLLKP